MSADNDDPDERLKWRKRYLTMILVVIALYFYLGTYLHI